MRTREQILKQVAAPAKSSANGEALIARLGRGRDLRKRITWPGGTLELELRVLSAGETAAAYAAAMAACVARGLDLNSTTPRAVEARVDEELTQTLARAIVDLDTGRPLFSSAEELASVATMDELALLFNLYIDQRQEVDPEIEEMPADQIAAIEDALKKKDERLLSAIASSMPRAWLRSTVVRLATSLMHSSTSTSAPSSLPPLSPSASAEA